MAYPGYVFHEYPKMISDPSKLLGYVIVKDEAEHKAYMEAQTPGPKVVKAPKKSLKFTIED